MDLATVIIVVAAFLVAFAMGKLMRGGIDKAEKWSQHLQSIATVVGIIAAVYLYNVERRSKPHADVSQTVQAVSLPGGDLAIEAYVTVKNLGTQLLTIDHIHSRVQTIDLKDLGAPNLLGLAGEQYQNATGIIDGTPKRLFEGTELNWRQLRFHDQDVLHEIEPGESDLITVTFVLPCPAVRYVRVATDVSKPETESWLAQLTKRTEPKGHAEKHSLVWKTRSMVDVEPACGKLEQ